MATGALWHCRPIFITSTFRGMQEERDWLRDRVFPALEERLRARQTHLEPIDLFWGNGDGSAAGELARKLLVLRVCLPNVECNPQFLIGLLNEFNGAALPQERTSK